MAAPTPDGIFRNLSALLTAKLAYLRARLQLAGLEGREAAVQYALVLAFVLVALVLAVFGYLFLVIALVFLVAAACGGGNAWIWVLLGAAGLHLAIAVTCVCLAKAKLFRPVFAATFEEFKKDQEWLKTPANPH